MEQIELFKYNTILGKTTQNKLGEKTGREREREIEKTNSILFGEECQEAIALMVNG